MEDLMKSRSLLLLCLFFIQNLSLFAQETTLVGRINGDGLRVREDWNLEAGIVDHLSVGEIVKVLDTSPSRTRIGDMNTHWYKISRGDITGWVYGYFLDLFIEVNHDEYRFRFSPALADSVDVRLKPGSKDGYSGIYYPPHSIFTLTGYRHTEASEKNRCIYIYPLQEHDGNTPLSAKRIAVLEKLLNNPGTVITRDDVPVFPDPPAHQLFVGHAKRIKNDFVEGIRFLTIFGQDMSWPVPGSILYIFQGFDADRSRWISGWFLVERPDVSIDRAAGEEGDGLYDQFRNFEKDLTAAADTDFTPDLELLDSLMLSVR